ncbi:DUF1365 domain-containing protein [Woodsholea maritima]|uniref:DUF1365 domain-containing protein n=1 Tax=Woodsholea maritima TaxID=240237 RepID=UPI00038050D5|nr:DUF1365 domain-containing protein [Woodsholea maritima]
MSMMTLPERLRAGEVLYHRAEVMHARTGDFTHRFTYAADYILLNLSAARSKALLARNRFSLYSVYDRDHGGQRGAGEGEAWAWQRFAEAGFAHGEDSVLGLMTQPRFLGFWFNPVSFWCLWQGEDLVAVIAEVNNTFGQRHSYLCHKDDHSAMSATDSVQAHKVFHVSPFQDVEGGYEFRFHLTADHSAIHIRYQAGARGLIATMSGALAPVRARQLVKAALLRPGGALRVVVLIGWQALKLKSKGAAYRSVPPIPQEEISR